MEQLAEQTFALGALTLMSEFTVDFEATQKIMKKGKNGGEYYVYSVVCSSRDIKNSIRVEPVSRDEYDLLKILALQGFISFAATRKYKGDSDRFGSVVISGVRKA